jgi:hypothetical protein
MDILRGQWIIQMQVLLPDGGAPTPSPGDA